MNLKVISEWNTRGCSQRKVKNYFIGTKSSLIFQDFNDALLVTWKLYAIK